MGFKEDLRAQRERLGLTQTEMARKAGVPFRSYQNWEAGSREPRLLALVALADALGATVDELIRPTASSGEGARRRGRTRKAKRDAQRPAGRKKG
jgi:transcriptional regulator with XRE-family HTH domain